MLTSAVGGNQGGFGFSRDVVMGKFGKAQRQFMCKT